MYEKDINLKMKKLPDSLKKEILDYTEFLIKKYKISKTEDKKIKFDWEGGLSELKDKYTSVELQHKALEWR